MKSRILCQQQNMYQMKAEFLTFQSTYNSLYTNIHEPRNINFTRRRTFDGTSVFSVIQTSVDLGWTFFISFLKRKFLKMPGKGCSNGFDTFSKSQQVKDWCLLHIQDATGKNFRPEIHPDRSENVLVSPEKWIWHLLLHLRSQFSGPLSVFAIFQLKKLVKKKKMHTTNFCVARSVQKEKLLMKENYNLKP